MLKCSGLKFGFSLDNAGALGYNKQAIQKSLAEAFWY